jgi:hypothetical protein
MVVLTITMIVISLAVADFSTRSALERVAFNKLTTVREMKIQQIEGYFQQITNKILSLWSVIPYNQLPINRNGDQ